MSNFTERAIKDSFIKLLNEKPLAQISVRMIVEDCGINRNSFYYHYQDLPALIEEIIKDDVDALIAKYPTVDSLNESINFIFNFMIANKNAVRHIYNSVSRDIFEKYLMQISDYFVKSFLDTAFSDVSVSDKDKETVVRFFKCEIFGLAFEWIMDDMKDDVVIQIRRITEVCRGLSDDLITRIQKAEKQNSDNSAGVV